MLINGQAATTLAATDRGLLYGDGLFETLAVSQGRPQCWSQHWQRLAAACQSLDIEPPDENLLYKESLSLCKNSKRAVLKIIITRGDGGRGYCPAEPRQAATRIVSLYDWPDFPAQAKMHGVKVRLCDIRLAQQPRLAGLKHLNRLEQVLARHEWHDPEIAEGLLLDQQGHLIEGTMSNLFLVCDGQLLTPELKLCGVAGIIRQLIIDDNISHGYPVHIKQFGPDVIAQANEMFLCNSLIGIWPVRQYDDRLINVGEIGHDLVKKLEHYLQS